MTSTASTRQASARDDILSLKHTIDKLDEITPETVDQLEEQVGEACVTVKSWHFEQGQDYGHLPVIIPEEEYRTLIGDPAWTYTVPVANAEEYNPAAVTCAANRRGQNEAAWTRQANNHLDFIGVCDGARQLIMYGAGEDAVVALKKKYTGYNTVSPKEMIQHLREKTCVKMTMLEKDRFKRKGYEKEWDMTKNIAIYWKHLDDHFDKCQNRGITTSEHEKVVAGVARMWESGFFTKEKMIEWEKLADADQTWTRVQEFFNDAYHDETQYATATSKKSRLNDQANSIEDGATEQTAQESDAAMMFAMMQQQHQEQLNQMKESNEKVMEMAQRTIKEMAAQMTALVNAMADGKPPTKNSIKQEDDKENEPPNTGRRNFSAHVPTKRLPMHDKPQLCKNCGKTVRHFEKDCMELESNKHLRPKGWKSSKK